MKIPRKAFSAVAATAFLMLLGAAPAAATVHTSTSDFTFSSFTADYYLGKDATGHATLRTVEKLTAVFPSSDQNKGITRQIPNQYRGEDLHTKLVSISDTNGVTKPYSIQNDGTIYQVDTGTDAYVHGSVTYTLTYTQQNVVGEFADTGDQEFYWDTNGTGWNQPFASVTARVHVDPSLVPTLSGHNACYRGAEGSKDTCEISDASTHSTSSGQTGSATGGPVYTASTTGLGANENMSVVIGFTDGTFTDAASGTDEGIDEAPAHPLSTPIWAEVIGGLLALVGLGGIPFALIRRFGFGQRDNKGRGTIIAEYSVPKGMNLVDAGSLIKRTVPAIPAQIVSFAVRGNLRILDYPVTQSGAKYTLELLNTTGLDTEETQLMQAFFPDLKPGAVFEMTAAAGPTAQIAAVRAQADAGIVQKGWRVHASARSGVITGLILLGAFIVDIIFLIVIGVAADATSVFAIIAVPFLFISMVVALVTARRGNVLTAAGAEQRDYLKGMQLYLTVAEEDRMHILQSPTGAERVNYGDKHEVVKLYEKLLPFAVLWGVEDQWSKVLAIHYTDTGTTSPDWWVSQNAFNSALFASSLVGLSGAITTSVTPVSTSYSGGGSSFGGSFGGGFSGGGGGGGGGGGR